jgi:FixJ family two-component response regulator
MSAAAAKVFVVDDDESVREALSSLIRSVGLEVATYASAGEFLGQPLPDSSACLVLDVRLPGMDGLELQRELAAAGVGIPIVFVTGHGDIPMSVRAMKAGAVEFLSKPFCEHDLLEAIRFSLERDRLACAQREDLARLRRRYVALTTREREILLPIVQGKLNKQVAAALGISEVTVKVHRRHIMEKLGVRSLAEMVHVAGKLHLGPPP